MRWARVEIDGEASYGIVDDDQVELVRGDPFDGHERTGRRVSTGAVDWLPPVIPPNFYAVGLNYAEHVRMAAELRGVAPDLPSQPDVGYRSANALIGHDQAIVIPADATERVEYEGEIVGVIGKKVHKISVDEALSCLLGYTIGNDVSERTWQRGDRTMWRAKNTDTFKPMGPWIETDVALSGMRTKVRVNGEEKIDFETNDMLFGMATYLSRMSQYLTLYPRDVIWMGTEGKADPIQHGDVVEVEISGIGTLRNPVVREGT